MMCSSRVAMSLPWGTRCGNLPRRPTLSSASFVCLLETHVSRSGLRQLLRKARADKLRLIANPAGAKNRHVCAVGAGKATEGGEWVSASGRVQVHPLAPRSEHLSGVHVDGHNMTD
eukprot:3234284-Pyramimonas_sp.AAC.1